MKFAATMVMTMPDELLCIDTNVMIWGILQNGKSDNEKRMIEKAACFFESGFQKNKLFAISIITFSELMTGIPPEKRDPYIDLISRNFVLLPFSEDAALKAADIFREQRLKMKSSYHGNRSILCQDIQILASAVVFGNVKLITEDVALSKLAEQYIPVCGLPEPPPEQLSFDLTPAMH